MPINKNSKNHKFHIAFLFLMAVSLGACYENAEGCLDPDSANYDVAADVDCDDCCTYPTLSLLVAYGFGEDGYNNDDTITNDIGMQFVIEDAQVYFSELILSDDAKDYRIDETFSYIDILGNAEVAIDDIILAKPSTFRHTVGTFTNSNIYTRLQLGLGIPEEIDQAQSISVTSDHPLAQAGDSLYVTNQYVNSWILLRQIGVHVVTDTLQITGPDFMYLFEDLDLSQTRGSSLDINIKIDYDQLISGVDYNTMNKTTVANKLYSNLKLAVQPNF